MQLISDMFGKWDTIYIWELLVLSFKKSSILTIWGLFQLFWLFCKWFKSDLKIIHLTLDVFIYMHSTYFIEYLVLSYIKILIPTVSHFLATSCWPVCCMSWISLNYPTYFTHVQKLMHCLYLRLFTILL